MVSSSENSSSEDEFPSPRTPKKRKKYSENENTYEDLINKVKNLQKKVCEIEIENKKIKSNLIK